MESSKNRLKVLCPVKNAKTEKTHWMRMGVAYPNRDGSTNVYLDTLPLNGRLQIRAWDDDDKAAPQRDMPF